MMKKYYVIPELKVYTLKPYCLMASSVNVDNEGALSDDGTIEDAEYALGRNSNIWDDEDVDEDEY